MGKIPTPKKKITTVKQNVYGCERCEINSLGERMCPCPRGGCDAVKIGTQTVTTEVKIMKKYES